MIEQRKIWKSPTTNLQKESTVCNIHKCNLGMAKKIKLFSKNRSNTGEMTQQRKENNGKTKDLGESNIKLAERNNSMQNSQM